MPNPEDWVSTSDPANGTEFGGVPGLIQPPPHELTEAGSPSWERANYLRSIPSAELVDVGTDDRGNTIRDWGSSYEAPPSTLVRP